VKYRRVLLKLSGEAFGQKGLEEEALAYLVNELQSAHALGVELAVVVGGGNFIRGSSLKFLERAIADRMGMLATAINGLALKAALARRKIPSLLQSAVRAEWAEKIHPERAKAALAEGEIVIFAGGTGNPFVTTDTAAAIRALEVGAEALLKATRVEGVYTADPKRDPQAKLIKSIAFAEAIQGRLGVMDLAALALCEQHQIPVVVFDFFEEGNLTRVLEGEEIGTQISV